MENKKIYYLFIFLGMSALIVCMVVGALYRMNWLIFLGFGICIVDFLAVGLTYGIKFIIELNNELKKNAQQERTPEKEEELLERINSATSREESMMAQAEYYGEGAENAGELIATAFGFSKENRKAFKKASAKEKAKTVLIFVWFGLTLLTFLAGISLSNARIQPAGFITMGVGGGSFFLTIIGFLIFSLVERNSYLRGVRERKRTKPDTVKIRGRNRTGVVKRCEIHSQFKTGSRRTPRISGTLYQIWVWTSDKEPLVRLACSRRYQKYEKVTFSESGGLIKRRRIIE